MPTYSTPQLATDAPVKQFRDLAILPISEGPSLAPNEIAALAKRTNALPGRWRVETNRSEDGSVYAGLVSSGNDPWAFQFILSGRPNDIFEVTDGAGKVVAEGFDVNAAFGAIQGVLAG